jgi:hypothetical protein
MPEPVWLFKYHNDYTEEMSADEYSHRVDKILCEMRQMYPFQGDSTNYHLIQDAACNVVDVPGLFCEIGFRAGAGIRFMMEGIHKTKSKRTLIAIDPYGSIPYEGYEKDNKTIVWEDTPYSNQMMKETLELMNRYVACYPYLHFLFFPMEDFEFFKRFSDGVPVYTDTEKKIVNEYALVHFDGPHTYDIVLNETKFFQDRTPIGAMFVYDDISHFYNHNKIEEFLFESGWLLVEKTMNKASYIKTN